MEIKLNEAQREAVDYIYGPLLVLAGPGTGKTQLLSARIANILQKTDVNASNILCLTFTESGAQNMRDRLRSLIGDASYDVSISTYHSFGSDIIKNYAEHFQELSLERTEDIRLERPVDELTQIQIVEKIIDSLPFDSPLIGARYYIKNVVGTISDLKQHLITPDKLREIAHSNLAQIQLAQKLIDKVVNEVGGISNKKVEKYAQYKHLLEGLQELHGDLIEACFSDLEEAHLKAEEINSPTPLREWKDKWLHKDENDFFTLTEISRSEKMLELANVYELYEKELKKRTAYDFDDMILRAIEGLKSDDELRFNLQEKYQFILLDEFQDTNPSQFELVKRIADHPVHEGRPNIMAVGDDDQAIFAFQGANVGNMRDFVQSFRDVKVINLTKNYRSHPDILHLAKNIAEQIEDRLHTSLPNISKTLEANSKKLPKAIDIERREFVSEANEDSWIAKKIEELISKGTNPSEIAVLAPKHKILEGLVPFLKEKNIPLTYEKRENILQTEIVQILRLNAKLVEALSAGDTHLANQYFPLVLGQSYWNISVEEIWKTNWQLAKYDETRSWAEIALESKILSSAVKFYLCLSASAKTNPLELTLDKLSGNLEVDIDGGKTFSPLKTFCFSKEKREVESLKYYEAISHLSVIRARLRDYQASSDRSLTLQDFLDFFVMYESADESLINSHPIAQTDNSVQLMTAYKSKGLEFENIFIMQAHEDVWGKSAGNSNKLSLPENLASIRYSGSSDDERRRLFFVAITRAKHNLFITSHTKKDTGKNTSPLKYLSETDGISAHLPPKHQTIISQDSNISEIAKNTEILWQAEQITLPADFRSLLADRLKSYQMSPTHLNTFVDMERGGPEVFLVQTLLKFPQAPSPSGEFGTAIHNTLEWYQNRLNRNENTSKDEVIKYFEIQIKRRYMTDTDREKASAKGKFALENYIKSRTDMFKRPSKAEVNFYNEGVVLEEAVLSGKIDRLEVDETSKTVRIVDYKTGKYLSKWGNDIKSLKYRQQLYFYKILIEKSVTWRNYKVEEARLEFVEPDKNGFIKPPLVIDFDETEFIELKNLIKVVWDKIQKLDLPDTSSFTTDLKGTKNFISSLEN